MEARGRQPATDHAYADFEATRSGSNATGAKTVPGATVCRRHGANASVRRNAERLTALREFHAALPYLQRWTAELVGEHERCGPLDDTSAMPLASAGSPRLITIRRFRPHGPMDPHPPAFPSLVTSEFVFRLLADGR